MAHKQVGAKLNVCMFEKALTEYKHSMIPVLVKLKIMVVKKEKKMIHTCKQTTH